MYRNGANLKHQEISRLDKDIMFLKRVLVICGAHLLAINPIFTPSAWSNPSRQPQKPSHSHTSVYIEFPCHYLLYTQP